MRQSAMLVLSLLLTLTPLPAQPAEVAWPTQSWTTSTPEGVDIKALERLLSVTDQYDTKIGSTYAIVIVQHGAIVAERYAPEIGPSTKLVSWSMAKSITQALTGIAVGDGSVMLDAPMGNPRWPAGDARHAITWRQWLNMTDGLDYHEIGTGPTTNDAAKMTYGVGRHDIIAYATSLPLKNKPGEVWNYNSAGINLVADALTRVVAPQATAAADKRGAMATFMRTRLFERIGMTSAQPEFDPQGTFIGASLVYATARDFAKFGLLYLRDGVWDGARVLPAGWGDFTRTKTPAANADVYGAGWWIAPASGDGHPDRTLTHTPGAFMAQGHRGQTIVVVPSKDVVLVRLGKLPTEHGWHALGDWTDAVLNLFPTSPAQ